MAALQPFKIPAHVRFVSSAGIHMKTRNATDHRTTIEHRVEIENLVIISLLIVLLKSSR